MAWIELAAAQSVLAPEDGKPGLFERVLGFRTATQKFRAVHMMNDVAQCVLGGAPDHGCDLLARIIRIDKDGEANTEEALRADESYGDAFSAAFPAGLEPKTIRTLRQAIGLVVNFDAGMYEPGKSMISPLATHRLLLGREGFRRFRVGAYVSRIVGDDGAARIKELFESDTDPVTQALRPVLLDGDLVERQKGGARPPALTPFDRALGRRLTTLLAQPLAKPTLLRYFALCSTFGVVLKIFGAGRENGRPMLLALAAERTNGPRPLRAEAVQTLHEGRELLLRRLAEVLEGDLGSRIKVRSTAPQGTDCVEVTGAGARAAREILDALAATGRAAEARGEDEEQDEAKEQRTWWPDRFAIHLGRKAGCVWPLADRAGWSSHLVMSPELVEILTLTDVAPGQAPVPWTKFWRDVRADLGVVVGASPKADADALREIGVTHISLQQLRDNSARLLSAAVRRGAARRLPDGGAEILGTQE